MYLQSCDGVPHYVSRPSMLIPPFGWGASGEPVRTWLLKRTIGGPRRTIEDRLLFKETTYCYIHTPFILVTIL